MVIITITCDICASWQVLCFTTFTWCNDCAFIFQSFHHLQESGLSSLLDDLHHGDREKATQSVCQYLSSISVKDASTKPNLTVQDVIKQDGAVQADLEDLKDDLISQTMMTHSDKASGDTSNADDLPKPDKMPREFTGADVSKMLKEYRDKQAKLILMKNNLDDKLKQNLQEKLNSRKQVGNENHR